MMKNNGISVVVLDQIDAFISCFGLQHVLAWVMIQIKLRENWAMGSEAFFFFFVLFCHACPALQIMNKPPLKVHVNN